MQREMPKYRSHKTVHALKIRAIELDGDGGGKIFPEESGFEPFAVSERYMDKHEPKPGGYYVVYADGYKSWSPAKAFEEGYLPMDDVQERAQPDEDDGTMTVRIRTIGNGANLVNATANTAAPGEKFDAVEHLRDLGAGFINKIDELGENARLNAIARTKMEEALSFAERSISARRT